MVRMEGRRGVERGRALAGTRHLRRRLDRHVVEFHARLIASEIDDAIGVDLHSGGVRRHDVQADAVPGARRHHEQADLARVLNEIRRALQDRSAATGGGAHIGGRRVPAGVGAAHGQGCGGAAGDAPERVVGAFPTRALRRRAQHGRRDQRRQQR